MTKKESGVLGIAPKPIRELIDYERTLGQKAADFITKWAGSWTFILLFFIFLAVWMATNGYFLLRFIWWDQVIDVYPFILLNLFLSCLAAIQAPIILMSQNRQAEKDRVKAGYDYAVNRKAERKIEEVLAKLNKFERKRKLK